ncbi:hypothetical protein B0T24DRAFT_670779 [Lasiosphaeria ovina]|uniref:Microbial-type PARG catalytic domain-containing protein n=1 Tax=Lasiosphaeria ovina TaxID=92902 RepID=A0AAE0JTZ3_9PEZI|nr:hypothetical protein B0T24DRAFT_670779 [Lasiosphaeria ovina]
MMQALFLFFPAESALLSTLLKGLAMRPVPRPMAAAVKRQYAGRGECGWRERYADDGPGGAKVGHWSVQTPPLALPRRGWLNGALAQEEALCYRSSLALSLYRRDYPLRPTEAVYRPMCLLSASPSPTVPVCCIPRPAPPTSPMSPPSPVSAVRKPKVFSYPRDLGRRDSLDSLRIRDGDDGRRDYRIFRAVSTAGIDSHACRVFQNPPEDVAHCWLEVLREHEFKGNWWRNVCFAVFDPRNDGNFDIFKRVLDDKQV